MKLKLFFILVLGLVVASAFIYFQETPVPKKKVIKSISFEEIEN